MLLENKIIEEEQRKVPLRKGDMQVIEESLETLNKLSLPQFGKWKEITKWPTWVKDHMAHT